MRIPPDWTYPLNYGDRLSNHDWVPLYVNRLLTSDFVAYACAEGRRGDLGTAIILWAESFKQDPAGTLPDDDVQLAMIARFGADIEGWRRARAGAMHGWVPVSIDNAEEDDKPRLGHMVIAGIAKDMHNRKAGRDQAREAGRMATLRSRVRKKLVALRYPKGVHGSDHVVQSIAEWLDQTGLFCNDENIRAAMENVIGLPRVVGGTHHREGGE